MSKEELKVFYREEILNDYTVCVPSLNRYVLSPDSQISQDKRRIMVCHCCMNNIREQAAKVKKAKRHPPKEAIASGYLLGRAPPVLKELTEIELAIVSRVRIHAHIFHYFGGNHKCVQGWHTIFKNPNMMTLGQFANVADSGLEGNVLVVLSGPFTTMQKDLTKEGALCNKEKMFEAIQWLIQFNYYHKEDVLPDPDNLPVPAILDKEVQIVDSEDVNIENRITTTVLFPDKDLPDPTNGGFKNQDEFRDFVARHQQTGKWDSTFIARHGPDRMKDYTGDVFAQAFPLLFPYGHSGMPEDKAVVALADRKGNKLQMAREKSGVIRKYMQHSLPGFHEGRFTLIAENTLLREAIFRSTSMKCNARRADQTRMGELYGDLKSTDLSNAIRQARSQSPAQYSANPANQFLQSIHATCKTLPHTNEAAEANRKRYFSFLSMFGLPALMLTVTPDDERSLRVLVYAIPPEKAGTMLNEESDIASLTDADVVAEHKIRRETRIKYPGLCAEEYARVIALVIKHVFGWDEKEQESTGLGLFGDVLAWCLATEEQGRKTLHGHFLIFIRNWNLILKRLQQQRDQKVFEEAIREAKAFHDNACSARLFEDFQPPSGPLCATQVFEHECPKKRDVRAKHQRVMPEQATDQELHEMRHCKKCHEHQGKIAKCQKCGTEFTMYGIVNNALHEQFESDEGAVEFPDRNKRLSRVVLEDQKDFDWHKKGADHEARRYFASNALSNVHLITHSARCFKKSNECNFALPDAPREDGTFVFLSQVLDVWYDWAGNAEDRRMFRFYPKRNIEDCFVNTHNPDLTKLLCCNTNVLVGLNGRSVYYCTCYNCKQQQREERQAYAAVAEVMVKNLERAVRIDQEIRIR